jgi:hypothetical protein
MSGRMNIVPYRGLRGINLYRKRAEIRGTVVPPPFKAFHFNKGPNIAPFASYPTALCRGPTTPGQSEERLPYSTPLQGSQLA